MDAIVDLRFPEPLYATSMRSDSGWAYTEMCFIHLIYADCRHIFSFLFFALPHWDA